jgi:hypothetical protein
MIDNHGKPLNRAAILAAIDVYNSEARGSSAFGAIPRALVMALDNLTPGEAVYVDGTDGQLQLRRGKDKKVVGRQ